MFCSNCGEKIEDSSSFCKNCGAKITNNDKTERVQLKCKECGGVMTADSSNKTLHCPYCGSDEVIVYGDAVEVERIKNDTYKEMEYKNGREQTKRSGKRKGKADEAYRKSGFGIVAIIGAIVSALFLIGSYSINRWGNVVVTAIQLLLFVVSVLIRKDIIKCSNRGIPALLTTIGLLLIIPFLILSK